MPKGSAWEEISKEKAAILYYTHTTLFQTGLQSTLIDSVVILFISRFILDAVEI